MTAVCVGLGVTCLLYYVFLVIRAGILINFGWFWLAAGAAFLLAAFLRRFPDKPVAVWSARILLAVLAAGFLAVGIMCAAVISKMSGSTAENLQYAVVLGAQVKGKTPSIALGQRLEKAFETAQENPQLTLILSGGKGQGELISEAECMRDFLVQRGIREDRLILEDKSTTTWENLVFSDRLTGCAKKRCGIITNDFHLCRAQKLAKKAGYQDACGIAAPSEHLMKPHYIVREAVALLYGKVRGA